MIGRRRHVILTLLCLLLLTFTTTIERIRAAPPPKDVIVPSAFVETSLHLSTANWTENIAKGSWFIEFFTPTSNSCKQFAQTWQELTSNKDNLRTAYPDAPFSLAQIDCSIELDLCVHEGVKHIPKLSVYRDGLQTESEFTGEREYTSLSSFVDEEASRYRAFRGVTDPIRPPLDADKQKPKQDTVVGPVLPVPNVPGPAPVAADQSANGHQDPKKDQGDAIHVDAEKINPAVAGVKHDDAVKPAAAERPNVQKNEPPASSSQGPNPDGKVLRFGIDAEVRDKQSLEHFLSRNSRRGSSFVKFFAPWCPHCRAMAAAFTRVAVELRGQVNVVEVDCEAHHSICVAFDIKSFPTLRMYNDGEVTDFKGTRSFDAMKNWATKAGRSAGVRQISAKELDDVARDDEVFFLYVHESGTPEGHINAFSKASHVLLSTLVHTYRTSDPELVLRFKSHLEKVLPGSALSGLLAFKDHNARTPAAILHLSNQHESIPGLVKSIGNWLDTKRYPTLIEVSGSTFNDVINNRQSVPVVLAALSDVHHSGRLEGTGTGSTVRNEELSTFRDLALKWRQRELDTQKSLSGTGRQRIEPVLFAWIDADRWATALQKYYGIQSTHTPRLLMINGSKFQYFDLPARPFTSSASAKPWIDADQVFETLDSIAKGNGPTPKSSRTQLEMGVYQSASFIESMLLWISNHLFTSFLLTLLCIALIVAYLRHRAAYMATHAQRLPSYGKVD